VERNDRDGLVEQQTLLAGKNYMAPQAQHLLGVARQVVERGMRAPRLFVSELLLSLNLRSLEEVRARRNGRNNK
jgi:hypothetical protein